MAEGNGSLTSWFMTCVRDRQTDPPLSEATVYYSSPFTANYGTTDSRFRTDVRLMSVVAMPTAAHGNTGLKSPLCPPPSTHPIITHVYCLRGRFDRHCERPRFKKTVKTSDLKISHSVYWPTSDCTIWWWPCVHWPFSTVWTTVYSRHRRKLFSVHHKLITSACRPPDNNQ